MTRSSQKKLQDLLRRRQLECLQLLYAFRASHKKTTTNNPITTSQQKSRQQKCNDQVEPHHRPFPQTISTRYQLAMGLPAPLCGTCEMLPSTHYLSDKGHTCSKCVQDAENSETVEELRSSFFGHPIFGVPKIAIHIVEFLQGTGLEYYCQCGRCSPSWFLRGWVCHGGD